MKNFQDEKVFDNLSDNFLKNLIKSFKRNACKISRRIFLTKNFWEVTSETCYGRTSRKISEGTCGSINWKIFEFIPRKSIGTILERTSGKIWTFDIIPDKTYERNSRKHLDALKNSQRSFQYNPREIFEIIFGSTMWYYLKEQTIRKKRSRNF